MFVLLFIIVLAVLILAHEFGHFIVAKKSGIRVDEFSLGFPPKIAKFKKGETTYSVGVIPFGGYVKIRGEEGDSVDDPRSFAAKPALIRAAVLAAGVFFNLLLAWFLFTFGFTIGTPVSTADFESKYIQNIKIYVVEVAENSPAQKAGLMTDDEITGFSSVSEFQKFLKDSAGKKVDLEYVREGNNFTTEIVPRENPPEGEGAAGVALNEVGIAQLPIHLAVWEGLKTTVLFTRAVAVGLVRFFMDLVRGMAGFESVSGPLGIVKITGAVAKMGFTFLLNFIALLSINLAVINILPFPALDGGRILFLLIEKIKGSPLSPKFSNIANGIGLTLLFILMIVITYHDILKMM